MSDPNTPKLSDDVIRLYDRFTHGAMDRRAFFERLTGLAGSVAAATALLPLLQNDYARAETVRPDDPRLVAEEKVAIPGSDAGLTGYLVGPKDRVKRPALVMIHENRGLNPHIRDMTRRGALAGYLTLGIDALSPEGGTPADEDKAREMIGQLNGDVAARRIAAAIRFLAAHPLSTPRRDMRCFRQIPGEPACPNRRSRSFPKMSSAFMIASPMAEWTGAPFSSA